MCGIVGIVGAQDNKKELLTKMLKEQHHRGPDATEQWHENFVSLGHNRLSIIDLRSSANQPMISNDERYVIVFNGEIYNYQELKRKLPDYTFRTKSDTEVLLAMYQKYRSEMLNELNGMFAFVIYDRKEQNLFFARDRFGVKPLYYAFDKGNLLFASEIKTLWSAGLPKVKNKKVWANYLAYGTYGLPNETFWDGVKQLPGGHYFYYSSNDQTIDVERWYDFVGNVKKVAPLDENELKQKYLDLLNDSIKLRFRSDVPVGFNLSGGLDSSTLLGLVNQIPKDSTKIEAFTFYCNDDRYDELPWVEDMIKMTGNPLNKCLLESDEVPQLINMLCHYQDEPFGGFPTLAYSKIFDKARSKGIIVLLDGQGMDEAWAGYDYYQTNSGFTIQGAKTSPVRPEVISDELLSYAKKEEFDKPFDSDLQNLQYRDLFYTKIPRALRFNDRISMMHSTELREPFLDYRLVELAFAQKNEVKIKSGLSKWMLREVVSDLLSDTIAFAPKRPLQTPQREWIASELNDYVNEQIKVFAQSDFVYADAVQQIWEEYMEGSQDNSFYIWQWINLAALG